MISLKEKENYDCIFLTENGCSVYEGRPRQCRTYPFWSSVVESKSSWEREGMSCPGIGKGKIHGKEEIESYLAMEPEDRPLTIV
jgi:Fe-S-cluster containining protein